MSVVIAALALIAAAPDRLDATKVPPLFKTDGPVVRVRVSVDDANQKMLRQDGRKPVRCTLRVDGEQFNDVGVHLKGSSGSVRSWDEKPGLTFNANKFTKNPPVRGETKFHLNNSVQDGSYLCEILANELALAAGSPGCRATHAIVELNNRKVGLYVLKESFDKVWLRRHFANPSGNLYDGGFLTDINGDLQLTEGFDCNRADLKAVAKACEIGDANKRYKAVCDVVDEDKFIAGAVVQIITGDWDGYIRKPNNYRVYFDPGTKKAVFVPHGMDQMWQNPQEQLWHGWGGMVARAVLDHPEGKKKTVAKLTEMLRDYFTVEKMHKRIDQLAPRAKEALAKVDKGQAEQLDNEVKGLKARIKERVEYMNKELPKLK